MKETLEQEQAKDLYDRSRWIFSNLQVKKFIVRIGRLLDSVGRQFEMHYRHTWRQFSTKMRNNLHSAREVPFLEFGLPPWGGGLCHIYDNTSFVPPVQVSTQGVAQNAITLSES